MNRSAKTLFRQLFRKNPKVAIGVLIVLVGIFFAVEYFGIGNSTTSSQPSTGTSSVNQSTEVHGERDLEVHFLSVGQADSTYIALPNGQNMLIDAGNNADGKPITDYLKKVGVTTIDWLIGTHPHEDHIGGLDVVIQSFAIGQVYMPWIADEMVPTTRTYEDVLDAIIEKELTATAAEAGQVLIHDPKIGLKVEVLSPVHEKAYQDLNDYSVALRITYGQKTFLFTGDAEREPEQDMLDSGADLSADVLKAGHHGSSTSTMQAFFDRVSPSAAVISCGVDNDYGHPHRETLAMFNKAKIDVYRTDEQGTIRAVCDGTKITFTTGLTACDGNTD